MARPVDPQRRRALLDSTIGFLSTEGLARMSMRPLAARLGVTTHTLTHHFGSKRGLIAEVAELVDARQLSMMREALSSGWDGLRVYWDWALTDNHLGELHISVEASLMSYRDPTPIPMQLIPNWIELFSAVMQERGLTEVDAQVRATKLHAVILGLVIDVSRTKDRARCTAALDDVIRDLQSDLGA